MSTSMANFHLHASEQFLALREAHVPSMRSTLSSRPYGGFPVQVTNFINHRVDAVTSAPVSVSPNLYMTVDRVERSIAASSAR